eukprot:TRINITY_DN343_c0_g5_i1.p1 TRINITY_DN343_c0_g5~~TRINITY_DN343_c0_g5_i1.p1  ORF type:complete len:176 (-),score=17.67 TRINITY_DN343_c0_g5_i1:488-1015(-)
MSTVVTTTQTYDRLAEGSSPKRACVAIGVLAAVTALAMVIAVVALAVGIVALSRDDSSPASPFLLIEYHRGNFTVPCEDKQSTTFLWSCPTKGALTIETNGGPEVYNVKYAGYPNFGSDDKMGFSRTGYHSIEIFTEGCDVPGITPPAGIAVFAEYTIPCAVVAVAPSLPAPPSL